MNLDNQKKIKCNEQHKKKKERKYTNLVNKKLLKCVLTMVWKESKIQNGPQERKEINDMNWSKKRQTK